MEKQGFFGDNSLWKEKNQEIIGFISFVFAIGQLLGLITFHAEESAHNLLGLTGHMFGWFWYTVFGVGAFPLLLAWGYCGAKQLFKKKESSHRVKNGLCILVLVSSCNLLLTMIGITFPEIEAFFTKFFNYQETGIFKLGGRPFYFFFSEIPNYNLHRLINFTGTALIAFSGIIVSSLLLAKISIEELYIKTKQNTVTSLKKLQDHFKKIPSFKKKEPINHSIDGPVVIKQEKKTAKIIEPSISSIEIPDLSKKTPKLDTTCSKSFSELAKQAEKTHVNGWKIKIPSFDLLDPPKKYDLSKVNKELKEKAELLEETLRSFGIEAKVGEIAYGPRITSFEVHPAVGVKIGKIKTLSHDLALNMQAKSIRIIAPIPGKAAVGIEIPNNEPQEVSFKEILLAYKKEGAQCRIPMLLGKNASGDLVISDLTKMPHCIIAGATGSGKSVCINAIIMSILLTRLPDEVRFLMVDPKKVELTPYSDLPHMLAPVITEPQDACMALNWLVHEMEKRYEMLKLTGQRNIEAFNQRKINKEIEATYPIDIPEKLTYYVAIIDELADLMMVSSQDIETPIARIAQMARAVGIHLILATQRPSREVITGLIKANFPSRIAFKVSSRVNSQIILDEIGAETLLGNGDMLLMLPGGPHLIRAQGVMLRDEEINQVTQAIKQQAPPQYIVKRFDSGLLQEGNGFSSKSESDDELYESAREIVFSTGNASTTFLQRKLKIGYPRAASLMDELEQNGVVGPSDGSKHRQIFFPKKELDEEE